jgi:hypothetical protein
MKTNLSRLLVIILVGIASASHAQTTATPALSLASGSYTMPQNVTISDGTAGASIKWCYDASGACTPSTTYSAAIYLAPATTETICADASATGYQTSPVTCNNYTRATTATPSISLASGSYSMPQSTTISDGTSGSTILWCYDASGACTPSTTYSGSIYIDPATTETICANASASGDQGSTTVCNSYTNGGPAATPVIALASGTYTMPQNTTISDSTAGASILWCYDASGACTPKTAYSGSIYIDPATTETICANATASGYTQSGTACANYTAAASSNITFSYANGQVTISTTEQNAKIFYTADGSKATEASIEYTGPFNASAGATINAVAVQVTSGSNQAVIVQNGQATYSDWKTNLACYASQCPEGNYSSPDLNPCPSNDNNTTSKGCQGVQGIPSQVAMKTSQTVPGFGSATNFNFTDNGQYPGSQNYGTQVLWPYNVGTTGCDQCTGMVEDFYIWPGQTPGDVENWELDMNSWVTATSPNVYRGASMQCSIVDGSWDYNGQNGSWYHFKDVVSSGYNHDCPLPTGTILANLDSTSCSFTVSPNATNSTVEPAMILWFKDNNEQVLVSSANGNSVTGCVRGYAGTTPASHNSGAAYSGSVHVQYHVTFIPGYTGYCKLREDGSTPTECVFIDYLTVNNFDVFNKSTYGTMTVDGQTVSKLYVNGDTMSSSYPDRVFDQKQIDVSSAYGSSGSPVQVGEYIDKDNVTSSFGILASQSYTVP